MRSLNPHESTQRANGAMSIIITDLTPADEVENLSDEPANVLGILPRGDVERCFRALYMTADYNKSASERQEDFAFCRTRMAEHPHDDE